jgi:hypothetical protein
MVPISSRAVVGLAVELRDEPIMKFGNGKKATRGHRMLGSLGWILPLLCCLPNKIRIVFNNCLVFNFGDAAVAHWMEPGVICSRVLPELFEADWGFHPLLFHGFSSGTRVGLIITLF